MVAEGILFYDADGNETECMALLKNLGMNSIRLRVWVDPADYFDITGLTPWGCSE